MKFSYVLPDPTSYRDWDEFDGDLACMKQAGYDAVELQIPDPAEFDESRVRRSLEAVGYAMCAFQTGSTYATRGNCLSTKDEAVRGRTIRLLERFVDLAARWKSVMVFGSLQGRLSDEPDCEAGEARIEQAMRRLGQHATAQGVTIAFEPVTQEEVGFNNTIESVARLVRRLALPGVRMMIDTFHMNIEEKDMFAPLPAIRDILVHVHLCETNRDVLVNIAGITARIPTDEIPPDQVRRLTEVNYYGTFWICKEVGKIMLAQGKGNIVNMSALGGGFLGTGRGNAAYSSTKGAIASLTKELACEWGTKGIRVNAVAPCWFQTEMNATSIFANPSFMSQVMTKLPMWRIGQPRELVGPIVFLASEASSMITGLVLPVDGGAAATCPIEWRTET